MGKRGLDQVAAWLLSLVLTGTIFGVGYGVVKVVGRRVAAADGELLSPSAAHDEEAGEHAEKKGEGEEGGANGEKAEHGEHGGGEEKGEHDEKAAPGEKAAHGEEKGESSEKKSEHEEGVKPHAAAGGGKDGVHWDYKGSSGPERWADLGGGMQACGAGKQQSPVDIDAPVMDAKLLPLRFNYKAADVKVKNNGHSLEVDFPLGNHVDIDGERYDLVQFHFHAPSEHKVAGIPYEFEAHLVHKNAEGKLAVVGVLFEEGAALKALAPILAAMPEEKGEAPDAVQFDPSLLLPKKRTFYTYQGSLTTPPCTEGVKWLVLTTPVTIAAKQIDAFVRVFGNTARPVQALRGRKVRKSAR